MWHYQVQKYNLKKWITTRNMSPTSLFSWFHSIIISLTRTESALRHCMWKHTATLKFIYVRSPSKIIVKKSKVPSKVHSNIQDTLALQQFLDMQLFFFCPYLVSFLINGKYVFTLLYFNTCYVLNTLLPCCDYCFESKPSQHPNWDFINFDLKSFFFK